MYFHHFRILWRTCMEVRHAIHNVMLITKSRNFIGLHFQFWTYQKHCDTVLGSHTRTFILCPVSLFRKIFSKSWKRRPEKYCGSSERRSGRSHITPKLKRFATKNCRKTGQCGFANGLQQEQFWRTSGCAMLSSGSDRMRQCGVQFHQQAQARAIFMDCWLLNVNCRIQKKNQKMTKQILWKQLEKIWRRHIPPKLKRFATKNCWKTGQCSFANGLQQEQFWRTSGCAMLSSGSDRKIKRWHISRQNSRFPIVEKCDSAVCSVTDRLKQEQFFMLVVKC